MVEVALRAARVGEAARFSRTTPMRPRPRPTGASIASRLSHNGRSREPAANRIMSVKTAMSPMAKTIMPAFASGAALRRFFDRPAVRTPLAAVGPELRGPEERASDTRKG